jgi:hypothetical protein
MISLIINQRNGNYAHSEIPSSRLAKIKQITPIVGEGGVLQKLCRLLVVH